MLRNFFLCLGLLAGMQATQAQSVGGMFKIKPAGEAPSSIQVNAYIDANHAPAGGFYIGNANWNFSGGYQYTALGTNLSFARDLRGRVISTTGTCFGTLNNFYFPGSRTKVLAFTAFASILGIGNSTVTLFDFATKKAIVSYYGYGVSPPGWLSLDN